MDYAESTIITKWSCISFRFCWQIQSRCLRRSVTNTQLHQQSALIDHNISTHVSQTWCCSC